MKVQNWLMALGLILIIPARPGGAAGLAGMEVKSQSGVVYLNGGIGDEQQEAIKAIRDEYNLQLTFAARQSGEFLSNVHLIIRSAAGLQFLEEKDMGPIFLARLANGSYVVIATYAGQTQTRTITVDKSRIRELYFYW